MVHEQLYDMPKHDDDSSSAAKAMVPGDKGPLRWMKMANQWLQVKAFAKTNAPDAEAAAERARKAYVAQLIPADEEAYRFLSDYLESMQRGTCSVSGQFSVPTLDVDGALAAGAVRTTLKTWDDATASDVTATLAMAMINKMGSEVVKRA